MDIKNVFFYADHRRSLYGAITKGRKKYINSSKRILFISIAQRGLLNFLMS